MEQVVKENSITQGVIWKQLLIFFFPILIGTFFQQLYNCLLYTSPSPRDA